MKKVEAVISLINSLSKSEKKQVYLQILKGEKQKTYQSLYEIITNNRHPQSEVVKKEFYQQYPKGSFEVSIQYLYDKLLDTLLGLRKQHDTSYDMLNDLCKVRMLYDRSMFEACFELLSATIQQARHYEYYEILLLAQKLELEYLLRLNFPNMTEQELQHKHFIQSDALKKVRDITEQAALHDSLKYRLSRLRSIRTEKQKQSMNDLVINEAYIVASSASEENFELLRNHKLFQANYLMGTGDYRAALETYKDLNTLFEQNPLHWKNPPIYYLSVLEGMLDSMRFAGNYNEMPYFIDKIQMLANRASLEFKVNLTCVIFQYQLFPYIDRGDFDSCNNLMLQYKEALYDKEAWLSPHRKSELLLYTALVHIGSQQYKKAKKFISKAFIDYNIRYLPLMKTIRLVQLIVYYELQEFDLIQSESRSIQRDLSTMREKAFKTERLIIWFLNKRDLPILRRDRELLMEKLSNKIEDIYNDKYEQQLLYLFDYIAWMKSKILRLPLSDVLEQRFLIRTSTPKR